MHRRAELFPTPLLLYNQFGEMFFRRFLEGINFNAELVLRGLYYR
jgi:hypothetical protein